MIPCTSTGDLNLCILSTSEGTFSLVAPISESGDGHIKFSAYCQILDFSTLYVFMSGELPKY